jgi:hypothetical protein
MLDHDTLTWKFRSEPNPGTNGRAYAPRSASVKVGSHFDILTKNGQKLHQTTDRNRSGRKRIKADTCACVVPRSSAALVWVSLAL